MNSCGSLNIGTKLKLIDDSDTSTDSIEPQSEDDNKHSNSKSNTKTNILKSHNSFAVCPKSSNNSTNHSFLRFKSRTSGEPRNEFRMARGGICGDRGRGGGTRGRAFKKSIDRESNIHTNYSITPSRSKFQESLKNQENKYYDDKKINEDARISKLLRRLSREEDYEHFINICKQIQEGIGAPENQKYIKRNLEVLCDNILDAFYTGPNLDSKQHAAKCLGRLGYISGIDFKRFVDWLFSKYTLEHKDDIKSLLIKSFRETLILDSETLKLKDYASDIMAELQSVLENVDKSDLLLATVDAILVVVNTYPECFSEYFRDTVDILVGWHIDPTQQKYIINYASQSLQKLQSFWVTDLQFTLTLLGQFIEDMESYDEELTISNSGRNSPGDVDSLNGPQECISRINSLISVFNTVTKCISRDLDPTVNPLVQWDFLINCLSKILHTSIKAIKLEENIEALNNHTALNKEKIEKIMKYVKNMNLNQKKVDELLKNLSNNDKNEEDLIQMVKSLNLDKNSSDRKSFKINDLNKDKEKLIIQTLKSMDFKICKSSDLSGEKEKLIIVANECIVLLLNYLQSRMTDSHNLLYEFIELQLKGIDLFWDETIISILNTISIVIKEISANLPLDLVYILLGKDSQIIKLRFRNSIFIQNAVLGVYYSLLSLKNIPLLQEAYKFILADLEIAYRTVIRNAESLIPDNPLNDWKYDKKHAEIVTIFLLRALSNIANASNSIIGMWALKPSILELLAIKLKPYNIELACKSPVLQYHILFLLYSHSSRYNHFVPSSSLITGSSICRPLELFPNNLEMPTVSPTSGNLSIILDLIARTIQNQKAPYQVLKLLLEWVQEINAQAENYMIILCKTKEYAALFSNLIICGTNTNPIISKLVCQNIETLLKISQMYWADEIFTKSIHLSILHSTSLDRTIREKYGMLLTFIPINIVISKITKTGLLLETKKFRSIKNYSLESLILAQRLHMKNNNGEMQPQHFKNYMNFLLQQHSNDTELFEIFSLCWPTIFDNETLAQMYEFGSSNCSFLFFWGGFEAAQYCIQNKLRTPLGKPQETFTTIEGALKILAREISYFSEDFIQEKRDLEYLLQEHTRVRLLIEFLEHLERLIYNAADGCAVALLPFSKPVRTFFHTNRSTCREWFNRIRLAMCVVSLHAGLATCALRNGQRLLEDLSTANNTLGPEFERATLCTAKAMVMLREAEALQGLYVYAKEKDRKFPWLRAAMDEASGRQELAAESYKQILEDHILVSASEDIKTAKSESDYQVVTFCMERLSKCLISVCDWDQLEKWKSRENEILSQEKYSPLRKQMFENVSLLQVTCLRKFEASESLSLHELSNWNLLNQNTKNNWSCAKTMTECSNTLINIALKIDTQNNFDVSFKTDINNCKQISAKIMEEGLRNRPSEYLDEAILLRYYATGLENVILHFEKSQNNLKLSNFDHIDPFNSSLLTQVLWWSNFFNKHSNNTWDEISGLRLHVARTARKEGNFILARREIGNYFCSEQVLSKSHSMFDEIVDKIIANRFSVDWTVNNMKAFREISKLLYHVERTEEALKICSVTALGISKSIIHQGETAPSILRELGTKMLLTLGKWIQIEPKFDKSTSITEFSKFESEYNSEKIDKLFDTPSELIPAGDVVVGKLLRLGVNQCPDLPNIWSNYAAWCYKWGKKIVDNSNSGMLTDTDRKNIQSFLPIDITEMDLNNVFSILGQKNRVIPEDENDIDTNDMNTSENIETMLRAVPALTGFNSEKLGKLIDIWKEARNRIYSYYELSAKSYFTYLQLAKDSNNCETITATLRLLRLVVKHASELQNVLESGLSCTPTGPWKEIIPQLFSRLSHPENYVRTRVSELLCRIAESSPHLITFPAVVGAVTGKKSDIDNSTFSRESDDLNYFINDGIHSIQDKNQCFMELCFNQLTECLSRRIPASVDQIKVLVTELRRITLLWDELWFATLNQHHSEFTKRFEQLEIELQKVQDNSWLSSEEKEHLISEKYNIILKPIIFILENLYAITSVPPETAHEKQFQYKFNPYIRKMIEKLKSPKNAVKPQLGCTLIKQLETKLSQRIHKRSVYSLSMIDISPILSNLKDTSIAMPGISTTYGNKIVTIKAVENNVQVLPTKTKPKKLIFRGSDGLLYTYLFKGLEDLHLDERIMQFLSICNTMMSKNNKKDSKKVYRARHYSVIPLGPRSGLIQWVDGVTPLFALYKRWQQRESSMQTKSNIVNNILRPSELFYSKLTPLLKERNLSTDNRKEWPITILKQVLAELMAETPKDLLSKEIWCNSVNSGSWWQATKNYSYSVAVMSIIGYIIGLGDRHLDNVLVDLNTGEVVHIDYNVCFEKGKTLRVPEKVPFRMTPNIKTALGVTGVEGIFRLACEHTLRVMRRGRETLLTLLEAFVYEPLVDWRAGGDNEIATYGACQVRARCQGAGRKHLENELTAAMFSVRIAEMKSEWLANKDELGKSFIAINTSLNQWIELQTNIDSIQISLQDKKKQLNLVQEASIKGQHHAIFSLPKRFQAFKNAKVIFDNNKVNIKEKLKECQKQILSHKLAFNAVRVSQLNKWISELDNSSIQEDHLVFDLVKEFLQNAGQNQVIVQCEQSENELTQLAMQQCILIRSCIDLLRQYSAICSLYPLSHVTQHRSLLYLKWSNKLMESNNISTYHEILANFKSLIEPISKSDPRIQQIIAFSYQIQSILASSNEKFKKLYEKMLSDGSTESLDNLKRTCNESKSQIDKFLKREQGAELALECVIIQILCNLNKKYLMMEGAAKCAGDSLVDLTSRDGDWFLDEMRIMALLITKMISLLPEHQKSNDQKIIGVLRCLKSANQIHKSLQELNYNFHTVILPEAMKTIITEETSVLEILKDIDEIVSSSNYSLTQIIELLELHLRFTIMEMESPHVSIQSIVKTIKLKFESLLLMNDPNQEENFTTGQMLLIGFNGLFEKLQLEGIELMNTLSTLDMPASWRKIDQIREARESSAPIFKDNTRQILDDIFFIKRIYTIQKFFNMCNSFGSAFRADNNTESAVYNDEHLNEPVRTFSADYVSRQLIGLGSQSLAVAICLLLEHIEIDVAEEVEQRDVGAEGKVSLEELCKTVIDSVITNKELSGVILTQAGNLCSTLEINWRKLQTAKLLQKSFELARDSVQRLQLQFTAHCWLHEDFLITANMNLINPLNRPAFMLELRKSATALATLQNRVAESREQQQSLISNAVQRLKWAAGANPALAEVMSAFDEAVILSSEKLAQQANLSTSIATTCGSIFHYEALRTHTQESTANDANFLKLLTQWEESCLLITNMNSTISPLEEMLIKHFPNYQQEFIIDIPNLKQIEKVISLAVLSDGKDLEENEEEAVKITLALQDQVSLLQVIMAEHHRLMNDVRTLLRSLVKQEKIPGLQEFLTNYRIWTENLSTTVKELESENLDVEKAVLLVSNIENLAKQTPILYDELQNFANKSMNDYKHSEGDCQKRKVNKHDSSCFSPKKGNTAIRDPTTGKAVQERNIYALNVWRRVRMKLEGRDPNPFRKYSTAEQVEYVIREATSAENLALLYEGWTPWV